MFMKGLSQFAEFHEQRVAFVSPCSWMHVPSLQSNDKYVDSLCQSGDAAFLKLFFYMILVKYIRTTMNIDADAYLRSTSADYSVPREEHPKPE